MEEAWYDYSCFEKFVTSTYMLNHELLLFVQLVIGDPSKRDIMLFIVCWTEWGGGLAVHVASPYLADTLSGMEPARIAAPKGPAYLPVLYAFGVAPKNLASLPVLGELGVALKNPAYSHVLSGVMKTARKKRRASANAKGPGPDGLNLQEREDKAKIYAEVEGLHVPNTFAEAVATYQGTDLDKKLVRIFIASRLIPDERLRDTDAARRSLLVELKEGLLLTGMQRSSNEHATLMLAFSRRLAIDKEDQPLRATSERFSKMISAMEPAFVTSPKDFAYLPVPSDVADKARKKCSALRFRRKAGSKVKGPEPDGLNLQEREAEAEIYAEAEGLHVPKTMLEAVAMYQRADLNKKLVRIFIASRLIPEKHLKDDHAAKQSLFVELKEGLLLAGVEGASNEHATLMLAFSQRLAIDKGAARKRP